TATDMYAFAAGFCGSLTAAYQYSPRELSRLKATLVFEIYSSLSRLAAAGLNDAMTSGSLLTNAAGYVIFEMLYREFLFGNNCLDDIADRNDSGQSTIFQHRQVPNALISHFFHTVLDTLFRMHVMNRRTHDLSNRDFT